MLSRLTVATLCSLALLVGCNKTVEHSTTNSHIAKDAAEFTTYSAEQFFATKSYSGNDINHNASALLVAPSASKSPTIIILACATTASTQP